MGIPGSPMLIPEGPPQSIETLPAMPQMRSMEGAQAQEPESGIRVIDRGYNGGVLPSSFDALDVPKPLPKIPALAKIMATVAAVKGSPGPMMQLMQQERSMEAFNSIIPKIAKANRLTARGDYAEAEKVLTAELGAAGLVPEIAQFIQPMLEKIYKSQTAEKYVDSLIAMRKIDIATHPDDKRNTAVNNAYIEKLKVIRGLPTEKAVEDALKHEGISFHMDTKNQQVIGTTSVGTVRPHVLTQTFDDKVFDSPQGQSVLSQLQLRADEAANILKGNPVYRGNEDITPMWQPIVQAAVVGIPGAEAQRTLARDATWTPEYTTAFAQELAAQGIPPEIANKIISSKGGGLDSGRLANIHSAVDRRLKERRVDFAGAEVEAFDRLSMESAPNQKGYVAINQDDTSDTFARRVPGVTFNEVKGSKGKMGRISETIFNEQIVPASKALDALAMVPEMMASAERPEGDIDRLSTGLGRMWTRWTGTADPQAAKLEAASVMISRALEVALETQTVKTQDADIMKKLISKPFNSEESALEATKQVSTMLKRNIKQYMDQESKIPPRPTMSDLEKAGAVKPVTIKGEKKGVSATYQPFPASSTPEVKAIQETVNGLIAERLKIPGQKALKGDYVSDKDSLLVAQQKLADANKKALEVEGLTQVPSGGTIDFNKAKKAQ